VPYAEWHGVQTRTKLANLKTFSYEFYGGIFTGFKNITSYLVKQGEPIPLKFLRKTHVKGSQGVIKGSSRAKCKVNSSQGVKSCKVQSELINYGQVPFGYQDVSGTLQKDPMEQFVLQQIKQMRDDGTSLNDIAKYLTQSGVPAKNGGRWQSNTVNKILGRAI